MFAVRLLVGVLKGLTVGGLIGCGLVAAGLGLPGALVAYGAAAVVGALVAMIAGKKIWEKDAQVQVMLKAAAGLLLAPGLLWLVRRLLAFPLPFALPQLPGLGALTATSPAIGMFAVTSLAIVGAVLAGFYDADDSPEQKDAAGKPAARSAAPAPKGRVDPELAAITGLDPTEIEALEAEANARKAKE
jgi:hypothetical protein